MQLLFIATLVASTFSTPLPLNPDFLEVAAESDYCERPDEFTSFKERCEEAVQDGYFRFTRCRKECDEATGGPPNIEEAPTAPPAPAAAHCGNVSAIHTYYTKERCNSYNQQSCKDVWPGCEWHAAVTAPPTAPPAPAADAMIDFGYGKTCGGNYRIFDPRGTKAHYTGKTQEDCMELCGQNEQCHGIQYDTSSNCAMLEGDVTKDGTRHDEIGCAAKVPAAPAAPAAP